MNITTELTSKQLYDKKRNLARRSIPGFLEHKRNVERLRYNTEDSQKKRSTLWKSTVYKEVNKKRNTLWYKDPENRKRAIANSRNNHLKKHYKLTTEQYSKIYQLQDGICLICNKTTTRKLSVDHDHMCCPSKITCGKCIRGLLCVRCNTILACCNDDINILEESINYLKTKGNNEHINRAVTPF
jgi:hypothetical protein